MVDNKSATIATYLISSTLLMILNKLCLHHFDKPYTLTWLQLLFFCLATLIIESMKKSKRSKQKFEFMDTKLSTSFFIPGILWSLPLGFNMKALSYLNPDTLIMFRTATIFGVALGDYFLFHRRFQPYQLYSLFLVFVGAYTYAADNMTITTPGTIFGTLYWAAFICSQLILKSAFEQSRTKSVWIKTFYINLYGSIPIIVLGTIYEGLPFNLLMSMNAAGKFFFFISLLCGIILSYSASLVRDNLSATSFDVLGCAGKFLTLLISFQVFPVRIHFKMILGLCTALFGSLLYSEVLFKFVVNTFKNLLKNKRFVLLYVVLGYCSFSYIKHKENIYFTHGASRVRAPLTPMNDKLNISFLFEITESSFGQDAGAQKPLLKFLNSLRSSVYPWIESYDHSYYEIIGHADLSCIDSSKHMILSKWYNLIGFDKRESLMVVNKLALQSRIISGILMSQADVVAVLSYNHAIPEEPYWMNPLLKSFEVYPKLAVMSVRLSHDTGPILLIRRAFFVLYHSKFTQKDNPVSCKLSIPEWLQELAEICKKSGLALQNIDVTSFKSPGISILRSRTFEARLLRGMSGTIPLKNNSQFVSELSAHQKLDKCKGMVEKKYDLLQKNMPSQRLARKYAKEGESYLNSPINKEDEAKLNIIRQLHSVGESALSVTFALEFFKHRDNIIPLLKVYRKLIKKRGSRGNQDQIIFLDDGSHDGSFEVLIGSIGQNEVVLALNNIEQIRAYTRALHISRTDIFVMLQDDDLPALPKRSEDDWLGNALKMFDAYPRLGAISLMCSYTTAQLYGNTWGHCRAGQGIPTVDPCTGVEFAFAVAGDSSPIFYRRIALEEAGGLLFSWNAPIQVTDLEYNFSTHKSYSYMVGAEAEVSFRMWRNGYSWGTMQAPGMERSFGGKGTYHGIRREIALRSDLPNHMKWRRYMLWRQHRRMLREHMERYSFIERENIAREVESLNKKLICRRPEGVKVCSLFRPLQPRKTIEHGKLPLSESMFQNLLENVQVVYHCPIDYLAVVFDFEMIEDKGLHKNRPWPGNKGSWVRCEYVEDQMYWFQGSPYLTRKFEAGKGWIPSWTVPYLGLRELIR